MSLLLLSVVLAIGPAFPPTAACPPCYAGVPPACFPLPPPAGEVGTLTPRFLVTHVVYSVPGRSSSMQYRQGDSVGSSLTTSSSWKSDTSVTVGQRTGILIAGGNFQIEVGSGYSSGFSVANDVTFTTTSGYRKPGQADDINHEDDEIWFLVKPPFKSTYTPASKCYGGPRLRLDFMADGTPPLATYLTLGELMGTQPIEVGMQTALNYWGIGPEDMAEMAKADPFLALGTEPNAPMDPARFAFVKAFPYRPPEPGRQVSSQTLDLAERGSTTSTETRSVDFFIAAQFGGSLGFLSLADATFLVKNRMSVTNSTSRRLSRESTRTNSVTVGQPSAGYEGPQVLRVYEDRVWNTYVFALDWY